MTARRVTLVLVAAVLALAGWLLLRGSPPPTPVPLPDPVAPSIAPSTTSLPSASATETNRAPSAAPSRPRLSAEARQAMLDSLAKARAQRQSSVGTGGGSGAPSTGDGGGTLDKDYIRAQVREILPLLTECYTNTLRDHPRAAGRMVVKFSIVAEESVGGMIESSEVADESTLREPQMMECVRETMYALRMTAPRGGGRVSVTYPFEFANDGPPDGG